jgi:alpha,alpha-trehalase
VETDRIILSKSRYDAVILDLEGVVTRTAKVHFNAWKRLFDDYLETHATGDKGNPFTHEDYLRYVDGKPRYEGVRSFLESRGIEMAYGNPDDEPGKESICGLGNLKNRYFQELLEKNGVEVYKPTVFLLHELRSAGFKTGVISSSKNCVPVLKAAELMSLFDAKVDGVDSEKTGLKGKPSPDIFLAAAVKLQVKPERSVVIEDAIAGVEGGRKGGFALVIGVDRTGHPDRLAHHGADQVVADMSMIEVEKMASSGADPLPSALKQFNEILDRIQDRDIAVFLDYDGTLTPIVKNPDQAKLSEAMRDVLVALAGLVPVAIISGRDRPDVEQLVGIKTIYYAGSHGFDIAGPDGTKTGPENGKDFLPALDRAEKTLRESLETVPGVLVERKKFSIAVHYRNVAEGDVPEVRSAVQEMKGAFPELRLSGGKKILELQPAMDWHKGKALARLLDTVTPGAPDPVPFYIGDDVTDEDAFRAIRHNGIGIVVMESSRKSDAHYRLRNPDEVERFLRNLAAVRKGEHS